MRGGVLLLRAQLGGGPGLACRKEDRVVAEAVLAPGRPGDATRPLAAHDVLRVGAVTGQRQRRHGDEGGPSPFRGQVGELGEDEVEVGLIVAVAAAPPGGEHTRHPVQSLHRQPGVVGHGGQTAGLRARPRFDQRVLLEGRAGLGHLGVLGDVAEADDLDARHALGRQDAPQLGQLLLVARGDEQPHRLGRHHFTFGGSSPG